MGRKSDRSSWTQGHMAQGPGVSLPLPCLETVAPRSAKAPPRRARRLVSGQAVQATRVSFAGRRAQVSLALFIVAAGACASCRGVISGGGAFTPQTGAGGAGGSAVGGESAGAGGVGSAGTTGGVALPLVPGRSPLRRLSRVEYDNTVRDLVGDTTHPSSGFEPDTLADGFTNNADTQNVGTSLAQQYLGAAEALSVSATKNLVGLIGCDAVTGGDACVRSFVTTFGQRAWRRPLVATEIDQLAAVYAKGRLDFDVPTSVQMVLQVILMSPNFLYRVEHGIPSAGATVLPLSSWELASRLSYFLLGSMPDDALFTAAAADALGTPDQVAAQARRLLGVTGGAATDRIAQFFTEWFHLVNVASLQRDKTAFPTFTSTLGPAMLLETQTFVTRTIFGGPGDLSTLLTAPYTYASSAEIAALYGAGTPTADGKLMLDPKQRAGLLTQPALLATFAKADSTDPVHRGKFVFEDLLCGAIPPPPTNVNITPPIITPGTTARTRFAQHSSVATCAACHTFMDPIGLAFENYDAIGRWRDTEGGLTIDASGMLKGTDVDGPFVGAVQLAQKLAQSPKVSACAVRELFRFGFGRFETPEDAPTLDQLAGAFQTSQQKIVELLVAMTQVPAFIKLEVTP
jgi:Protein of unknown function (DUF1592)/Protein of unknown function (DUF1588)/Protein of unknown function (DUF1595)/Protein of unknown function (DUF1587)/Protein of unknown function (DUF1585)